MGNLARSLETNAPQTYKRKRELIDGIPVMISPGRPSHGTTAFNIASLLHTHSNKGKCRGFSENALIKLNDDNRFVPDVAVVCDPSIINDDEIDGAPALTVEVLSPTTASNDEQKRSEHMLKQALKSFGLWI